MREEVDLRFQGLLGTEGVLDRWVVGFNYDESRFVVEERDTLRQRVRAAGT